MSKYIFADLETTGFSRQWDYIIEVAALLYDTEEKKVIGKFHELIKPNKTIPKKITEITGITEEMVKDARNEYQVLMDFIEWVAMQQPDAIVGHNFKSFDQNFIKTKCTKYKIPLYDIEIIDTYHLARKKKIPVLDRTASGRPSYRQESLAKFYKIDYGVHRAMNDVEALIQIYEKMVEDGSIKKKREKYGF